MLSAKVTMMAWVAAPAVEMSATVMFWTIGGVDVAAGGKVSGSGEVEKVGAQRLAGVGEAGDLDGVARADRDAGGDVNGPGAALALGLPRSWSQNQLSTAMPLTRSSQPRHAVVLVVVADPDLVEAVGAGEAEAAPLLGDDPAATTCPF